MKVPYLFLGMLFVLVFLSQPVAAEVITLQAEIEISGGTSPVGASPWLTASFDDQAGPGSVALTLTNTNLTGNEFVSGWYINLDPALDPGSLIFSQTGKTGSFTDPVVSKSADAYKAGGGGDYDILFDFATGGGASARFGAGESVSFQITGIGTLIAQSFNWPKSETNKQHLMEAHVQSIGSEEKSGWVATPEPYSFVLFLLGSLGLIMLGRRQSG